MPLYSDPALWLERYGDFLFRMALLRVRDRTLAEDMVQETLLAAVESRHRYAGQSSEKTWLAGILKHKVLDHFRKAGREQPAGDDLAALADAVEDAFDVRGHWKSGLSRWMTPDAAFEREEFWKVLHECLSRMPKRLGDALVLREIEGMSTENICQELGIETTNNMWVILSRARMRMRNCLDARWFDRRTEEKS